VTLFRDLGQAEYSTAWIGKLHLFHHDFVAHYEERREYLTDWDSTVLTNCRRLIRVLCIVMSISII